MEIICDNLRVEFISWSFKVGNTSVIVSKFHENTKTNSVFVFGSLPHNFQGHRFLYIKDIPLSLSVFQQDTQTYIFTIYYVTKL